MYVRMYVRTYVHTSIMYVCMYVRTYVSTYEYVRTRALSAAVLGLSNKCMRKTLAVDASQRD
jgi:hypothetical protein